MKVKMWNKYRNLEHIYCDLSDMLKDYKIKVISFSFTTVREISPENTYHFAILIYEEI